MLTLTALVTHHFARRGARTKKDLIVSDTTGRDIHVLRGFGETFW